MLAMHLAYPILFLHPLSEPGFDKPPCRFSYLCWNFTIVGFVRWRGLAGRDDSLDSHSLSSEQLREELLVCLTGKVVEEIDHSFTLARSRFKCS